LKVEYGDQIEYGQSRGAYKTMSDQEHLDIINDYSEGPSMGKIAKKLDRSAATVHAQIHSHDESIDKLGYCVECRRLKGNHGAEKTGNRSASISTQTAS
jgi:IS30 family transposase